MGVCMHRMTTKKLVDLIESLRGKEFECRITIPADELMYAMYHEAEKSDERKNVRHGTDDYTGCKN